MSIIKSWAALSAAAPLQAYEYEAGPLGAEEVEIAVDYCGLCHSDLSMIDNEWGMSTYPLVPGHEVVGRVVALGSQAKGLRFGQVVGLGWTADSCMHCSTCMGGDHNLCSTAVPTIVGHHGGFAERVRSHWAWAIPLPEGVRPEVAGPLLCGGITVFNPLLEFEVLPTSRVGVVGIGGLGHMALRFAKAWGCEVTAFTSSPDKADEARSLGAHRVVSSRNKDEISAIAGHDSQRQCDSLASASKTLSGNASTMPSTDRISVAAMPPSGPLGYWPTSSSSQLSRTISHMPASRFSMWSPGPCGSPP